MMGWSDLPAWAQDATALAFLLMVPAALGAWLLPRHAPWPLVAALLRRHRGISAVFVMLVAIGIGTGAAILAAERGLREASARATDPFDVVVAAPGSEVTALLASIFLRPADMPLLDGAALAAVLDDPRAALAAPVGFGDSVDGAPVIGTVADLVRHLSPEVEGRMWSGPFEAVLGADLEHALGARLVPAHGHGPAADVAHGQALTVVGRMERTGTPWDDAVLTPIEGVWALHSLTDGRPTGEGPNGEGMRLGPPYDPALAPGVPAVLVRANSIADAYSFRAAHQREIGTMAFLPGAELAGLHALMGDAREVLSLIVLAALGLVALAILCGLALMARLFRRHIALLHALGAPQRFVTATLWLHAMAHLGAGAVLGLLVGWAVGPPVSRLVAERTGLAVVAAPAMPEALTTAAFLALTSIATLLASLASLRREPVIDLR